MKGRQALRVHPENKAVEDLQGGVACREKMDVRVNLGRKEILDSRDFTEGLVQLGVTEGMVLKVKWVQLEVPALLALLGLPETLALRVQLDLLELLVHLEALEALGRQEGMEGLG